MVGSVCNNCGEQNAPGTQFCTSCHAYLGWRDDTIAQRMPPAGPGANAGLEAAPVVGAYDPQSAPTQQFERDPFDIRVVVDELTVSLDGTPATVSVDVANTSTIVDSYVIEASELPPWLEVHPDRTELLPATTGTVTAAVRIVSSTMVVAQQMPLLLRVRNLAGRPAYKEVAVRVTVPVVAAPLTLRVEPRLAHVRDDSPVMCTVVVDNSRTNRWATVQLSASDPEQVVRTSWRDHQLQVPPGGEARTDVRFAAPPPEPGREVNRTVTISGTDGERYAETSVTLAQLASPAAFGLLSLRLDPSVLRLGGGRRGSMTAVVDNRRGAAPVRLTLRGYDQENKLRFGFSPATLDVRPGQLASALVSVAAPRTPAGKEVTRLVSVVASDGRADLRADGSVIQFASSQRGLARVLLTLLGGLLIVLGSTLRFATGDDSTAFQLTVTRVADEIRRRHPSFHPHFLRELAGSPFMDVLSVGLGLLVLAVLVVFGLTGPTGRLTRRSALLCALATVAAFIGVAILFEGSAPAWGVFVILAGCVTAYIGGLLARS